MSLAVLVVSLIVGVVSLLVVGVRSVAQLCGGLLSLDDDDDDNYDE